MVISGTSAPLNLCTQARRIRILIGFVKLFKFQKKAYSPPLGHLLDPFNWYQSRFPRNST
jgi:hypothetical protein